jgi:hypothetical protein
MKTSITLRLIASAASFAITFALFNAVTSLAEPLHLDHGLRLAQLQVPVTR